MPQRKARGIESGLQPHKEEYIMNKIMHYFHRLMFFVRMYKNWCTIVSRLMKHRQSTKFVLRNGTVFECPKQNNTLGIIEEIFYNNCYTPNFAIKENDVIVDIGANIGVFSVFAAQKTKNFVYAFEPVPENFVFLQKNIEANKVGNVKIFNCGISAKKGTENIDMNGVSGGHFVYGSGKGSENRKAMEIKVESLRNIMDENNIMEIDMLKIDCEGCEGKIFKSLPLEYLQRIKRISMEFHDNVSELKHDEIIRILTNAGFVTELKHVADSPFGYIYATNKQHL